MALWRLYYHLVWATKERQPMITPEMESELYGYIIGKADALECITHALGGIEDHIHLVVSIPPKLAVAEFVKKIKGSSAHHINHRQPTPSSDLIWQRGYGAFSLGGKHLERVVHYALHQKEHHQQQAQLIPILERDMDEDDGPAPWNHGSAIAGIRVIREVSKNIEE